MRVRSQKHDSFLRDHPARHRSFCRRRTATIGTNHGVLDISTIDTSSCWIHAACFISQVTEGFAYEQSPATLTDHRSSCFLCRSLTWVQRRRPRRQAAPSSTIASEFPSTFRTQPWSGRRLGTDAAPGLSMCSTAPDSLNHIHSRRPDLYGRGLGTTEPLGRSRCHLLWSQTDGAFDQQHTEKTDGSLFTIAHDVTIAAEDSLLMLFKTEQFCSERGRSF